MKASIEDLYISSTGITNNKIPLGISKWEWYIFQLDRTTETVMTNIFVCHALPGTILCFKHVRDNSGNMAWEQETSPRTNYAMRTVVKVSDLGFDDLRTFEGPLRMYTNAELV